MSAPRKLRNAAVTLSRCVVRSALDGGELLAFQKVLPYSFQAEDFEESWQLWGWKVVSSQEPLQSFRFTEDVCEVTVVKHTMPERIPRNVWVASWKWEGPGADAGWRKWYKEFRLFASSFPVTPLLGVTSQRDVVPFLLQAFAHQKRKEAIMARGDEEQPRTISGHERWSGRLWPGALHAAVKRTGEPLKQVRIFFEDWKANYFGVLLYVEAQIQKDPYKKYFH